MNTFLLAELHRAKHQGAKTLEVSTAELSEVMARLESLDKRAAIEFGGKPLGFVTGHKMKAMLAGARKYITVSAYKSENFDTEVSYLDLKI
jgi:hypothetical protein